MLKRRKKTIVKLLFLVLCVNSIPTTLTFAGEKTIIQPKVTNGHVTTGAAATLNTNNLAVGVVNNQLVNSSATNESDFTFDAKTGTITKYVGTNTEITIPSTINGVSVKSIGDKAFYMCWNLTSIKIPNSVTSIGKDAFANCTKLTNTTIPSGVKSIGDRAFSNCKAFTNIKIPSGVKSIGYSTFFGCNNLTSVTIPSSVTSIGNRAFMACSKLASITIPESVKSIGYGAFQECSSLTSIIIPNSVTSIGYYAFNGCSKLASITIPESVTSIEYGTFWSCRSLTSVIIPRSVTSIGKAAFAFCSSLTNITIPNSVTSIGEDAFNGCSKLTSVKVPDSVASIASGTFWDCSSLTCVTISNKVTNIGSHAFDNCRNAKFYIKSNTVKQLLINVGVDSSKIILTNSTNLPSVPANITSISAGYNSIKTSWSAVTGASGYEVYRSTSSIGTYSLVSSTTSTSFINTGLNTGTAYYYKVRAYKTVGTTKYYSSYSAVLSAKPVLTAPVNTISTSAGYNSTKTSWSPVTGASGYEVYRSASSTGTYSLVSTTALTSFTNTGLTTGTTYYYKVRAYRIVGTAKFYSSYSPVLSTKPVPAVPTNVTGKVSAESDFRFDSATGTITKYVGNDTTVVIPITINGVKVKSIGSGAFYNYGKLTSITIQNSVTAIRDFAFSGCSKLTNITIPNSVTTIGDSAFADCTSLTSITIPRSVTRISDSQFTGCSRLTSITIPSSVTSIGEGAFYSCSGLKNVTIPSTIKYISQGAFTNCTSLTSITIPSSVISIDYYAFSGCSSLTSVTIPSSVKNIGNYAFSACSKLASVTIPVTVTSIGKYAFDGCNNAKFYVKSPTTKQLLNGSGVSSTKIIVSNSTTSVAVPPKVESISVGYDSIKISWDGVVEASGYEISRATSSTGPYSVVSTTTSTSFTNTGLTTGARYYYRVRAYKTSGIAKVYSNYSEVSTKPVPSAPKSFASTRLSSTSIKLAWSTVSGSSGYEVYRATSSAGTYSLLKTTTVPNFTNTGLTTGITYYYKVRAYRTIGTTKIYSDWTAVKYTKC